MSKRIINYMALLPSMALYVYQIAIFTTDQELIIYGGFGILWFALLINKRSTDLLLFAGLSAMGLGFVPHRLRLGETDDFLVFLFPLIHFSSTYIYLRIATYKILLKKDSS